MFRSLQDTVYNMNLAHLSQAERTVFEHLDDAGLRTACTTYLIYRGRHRHEPSRDSPYVRLAEAAQFRHSVWGARELFYADLFDTRNTGCSSTLGMPGQRDRHAACVGEKLVADDAFDFLLFSLPDNDSYSHREGPAAQPDSIAGADARADAADGRRRRPGRVPGRARGDRDVRPFARSGRGGHEPVRRARPTGASSRRWIWSPTSAELAVCPGRARPRSTCWAREIARRRPPGWRLTWSVCRGWIWWRAWTAAGRWWPPRAASCASGRAEAATDARGARLGRGGRAWRPWTWRWTAAR